MDIAQALLNGRRPISETASSRKTGLYGIFAKSRNCLPGIPIPETGIVYVGMTEDSLDTRNHFLAKSSGFHSPRRSLGAILKDELGLLAIPRSPGASDTNWKNYAFAGDGENRLSAWMEQHLDYAIFELADNVREQENATIPAMEPPLNIDYKWPNPLIGHITKLRAACKAEAKAAR